MNKKGFTLVELLGVIVILVVIMTITFSVFTGSKHGAEDSIDEAIETMIKESSKKYIQKYKININDGNVYCLTLKNILDENLMSDPVKNANGDKISEGTKIKVSIVNGRYEVDVDVPTCTETIVSN